MTTLDPRDKNSAIALLHMRDEEGTKQTLFPLFVNFTDLNIPAGTPFKSFYGHEWLVTPAESITVPSQNKKGEKYSLKDYLINFLGKKVCFSNGGNMIPGMSKIYDNLYGPGYHVDLAYSILHPRYHIEMGGEINGWTEPILPMWPGGNNQSTPTPTPD
jgi:hypothetical protein